MKLLNVDYGYNIAINFIKTIQNGSKSNPPNNLSINKLVASYHNRKTYLKLLLSDKVFNKTLLGDLHN